MELEFESPGFYETQSPVFTRDLNGDRVCRSLPLCPLPFPRVLRTLWLTGVY